MKTVAFNIKEDKPVLSLTIWPHRSCDKKTFSLILLCISLILIAPSFLFLKIELALSILPFSLFSIMLLFFVGNKNFNDALLIEKLKIYPKTIIIERKEPNKNVKKWYSNPYWTKVNLYNNGPVESYLTLKGNGKEVELGSFLTPEERINLKKIIDETLFKLSSANFSSY
tara:strand:+ start:833 stop:1342 length:510 start_codon:yes stop_codon:yes gene_type:complete